MKFAVVIGDGIGCKQSEKQKKLDKYYEIEYNFKVLCQVAGEEIPACAGKEIKNGVQD